MEFFATTAVRLRAEDLQRHLRIDNLPQWCASIDKVLSHEGDRGDIYCVWGEMRVRRDVIRDGVRFMLPACINAVQWTVTAEGSGGVTVHCTSNRPDHEADFVESLEQFVADWKSGLENGLQRSAPDVAREDCDCGMWMA
ncbi:MAG: hypothetical protein CVV05_16945 [Gammaproteobacteria bacterium HGW-Gammaproteobacteria-1]|jgi:hypothetical protein|nr:MAG: hypothetical protein CVV05_16945 [Gammaproteobacteria bacterium HGW-Gammaproteobacteria-1]